MDELTHVDLFSGIGGFALACKWNGIRTIQFVEIDKFCQNILRKNFPGVSIHEDIKTFANTISKTIGGECGEFSNKGRRTRKNRRESIRQENRETRTSGIDSTVGNVAISKSRESGEQTEQEGWKDISGGNSEVFLLTGGFPCQPFSCAGKRKGTQDPRHLWTEMLRVIKTLKPKWIIGENVSGIINIKGMEQQDSESGMESETFNDGSDGQPSTVLIGILNDLEQAGYSVQILVIPACAVNAPHRRDRVWIVAHSNGAGGGTSSIRTNKDRTEKNKEQQFTQSECSGQDSDAPNANRDRLQEQRAEQPTDRDRQFYEADVSDSSLIGLQGSFQANGNEGEESYDKQLYGCSREWDRPWIEVATELCRVDDGLPRGMDRVNRLKALGNAIVPQIADQIIKAILKSETGGENV